MSRKRNSFFSNLSWWFAGEILLFGTACLLIVLFAIPSLSQAYAIAITLFIIIAVSFVLYRKSRKPAKLTES